MKAFTDGDGRTWDVVAGRESWGAIYAIFIPRADARREGETPEVRQSPMAATGYAEANGELEAMSDDDLRALLERSAPKNTG